MFARGRIRRVKIIGNVMSRRIAIGAVGIPQDLAEAFWALATMKPLWPVVRSLIVIFKPCAVFSSVTTSSSPGFISKVLALGVKVSLF